MIVNLNENEDSKFISIKIRLINLIDKYCRCSEWSSIEDEMGHALQKAGHYMDK
jgi:hypothetical protein